MKTILVVDDNEDQRRVLRRMLEGEGFQVIEACDGDKALQACKSAEPHLVVTDIFMPEKEGIALILDISRYHPSIKVIAISGGGSVIDMDILSMALQLGANQVFAKPVSKAELIQAVNEELAEACSPAPA